MNWTQYLPNPVAPVCDRGMTVQTILFPREKFTPLRAKAWAQHHGFKYGKVDTTGDYQRLRQYDPNKFVKGTFRTISFGKGGIKAVVGCPR
jgi:hypothetical protein